MTVIISILMTVIIMAGCQAQITPGNLEPTIEAMEATDITRTEATVSVHVYKRGTTDLTYLILRYGEAGNINREVQLSEPDKESHTYRLQELKPGTTYSWYVEGGTATATVRSATINFSTYPNERPTLSHLVALATGPVGIIGSFDITDDGDEPILEAGCEITNHTTHTTERIYLPSDHLTKGSHRIRIGALSLETNYTFTPFATNSIGETKGQSLDYTTRNSIVLEEAGTLSWLFEGSTKVVFEQLTISGYMNGDDFRFLRVLLGVPSPSSDTPIESLVTEVDLSDAVVTEGGGSYDGSRFTSANEISTGLFADCIKLQSILLPITATVLARDAFARCTSLATLTIPAEIMSVLPSADCTALHTINVSEANRNFTATDGVLLNSDGSEILWFPMGKTGAYTLPETITAIGENAFSGTNITSLQIPPSVKSIGRGAFAGSSLNEIFLPDNITNISEGMFQNCTSLSIVRLGSGTEFIGNYVFDGTNLKSLYIAASIPPFTTEDAFTDGTSTITQACTLYVPAGTKAVYRNHTKWGLFSNIEEF